MLAKIQNGDLKVTQNGRHPKSAGHLIFGLRLLIEVLGGVHQKHENKNRESS